MPPSNIAYCSKVPVPISDVALALVRIVIMMQLREDKEKRDWEPVDKLLDQIERQESLSPNVAVLKAEVLLAKDLPDEAEKFLQEALRKVLPRMPRHGWL